jgi:hypothetical protein
MMESDIVRKLILAVLMLVGCASVAAAETQMVDLPVNARVRAMTYAYCLTGDDGGIRHLLAERMVYTGRFTQAEADSTAAGWVAAGYCADALATADGRMPGLRAAVAAALAAEGFTVSEPITQQAIAMDAANKGFFSWLGKALRAVGNAISGAFSVGGSGHYEYYETGATKVCDRQWHVTVGSGGGAYEPTPFYPEPRPGAD